MGVRRNHGDEQPGFGWGPFICRIPLYHTRLEWPEMLKPIARACADALLSIENRGPWTGIPGSADTYIGNHPIEEE